MSVVLLKQHGLRFGAPGASAVHLCVDMQRMFAEGSRWAMPWMSRVLPQVVTLADAQPERLCFTRFIPLRHAAEGRGTWRRYYERWPDMTRDELAGEMLDLVPPLDRYAPPAPVIDKHVYGPWQTTPLADQLAAAGKDTLIISGGETEVCVLATVLGAIDLGFRVIIAVDALCSSSDQTHDAIMAVYHNRFGSQVETSTVAELVDCWC